VGGWEGGKRAVWAGGKKPGEWGGGGGGREDGRKAYYIRVHANRGVKRTGRTVRRYRRGRRGGREGGREGGNGRGCLGGHENCVCMCMCSVCMQHVNGDVDKSVQLRVRKGEN